MKRAATRAAIKLMRTHKSFCALALFAAACGGSHKGAETPRLPAAKPEAVEKARADHAEKSAEAERYRAALERLG